MLKHRLFSNKKFRVNKYITLKLKKGKTEIYVKRRYVKKRFLQCKFLFLNIPIDRISLFDEIKSVDEAAEELDRSLEHPKEISLPSETEFWGHSSNLQVWYENDYNTCLLHKNIAFPLLKILAELGDPLAKFKFQEEIAKRYETGNHTVRKFLKVEGYLNYLEEEQLKSIGFDKNEIEHIFNAIKIQCPDCGDLIDIKGKKFKDEGCNKIFQESEIRERCGV